VQLLRVHGATLAIFAMGVAVGGAFVLGGAGGGGLLGVALGFAIAGFAVAIAFFCISLSRAQPYA